MNWQEGVDLAIVIFCSFLFLAYHYWYFVLRGKFAACGNNTYVNLFTTSRKTRNLWCQVMWSDEKEGINAVQAMRNMAAAVALLAVATTQLVSQLLLCITDGSRLAQLETYAKNDPIVGGGSVASPQAKLGIDLGILFMSLLLGSQCVRLSIHLGFLIRVIPSHPHLNLPLREETVGMMQRASLYFTLSLRALYLFFPFMMWVLGATAMLITMVVMVIALAFMDQVPAGQVAWLELEGASPRSVDTAETITRPATRRNSLEQQQPQLAVTVEQPVVVAALGSAVGSTAQAQMLAATELVRQRRPVSHAGSSNGAAAAELTLPV